MPKRPCPFEQSSPLQWKFHVGSKELQQSVYGEELLAEVYGKTNNLLFAGAKKAFNNQIFDETEEKNAHGLALSKDQMLLDYSGRLFPQSKTQEKHEDCEDMEVESQPCQQEDLTTSQTPLPCIPPGYANKHQEWGRAPSCCIVCKKVGMGMHLCSLCTQFVCLACYSPCSNCAQAFCPDCYCTNYHGHWEENVCLRCAWSNYS